MTVDMGRRHVQKECGRLIHILTKKLKKLEVEVARMRSVVEAEEQTFSPNGMPLSPRLAVQSRSPQNLDWNDVNVVKNKQKDDGLDIAQTLKEAKKKFDEMDRNKNGFLEGNELLALSDWCWKQFPVTGKEITKSNRKQAATDLLERTDHNRDNKIDFDEFAEWFVRYISKFKKQKLERKESSEDGRDDEKVARKGASPASRFRRNEPPTSTFIQPKKPAQRRWEDTPMGRKEEKTDAFGRTKVNRKQPEPRTKSPVVASVSVNHKFSLSSTPNKRISPSPSRPSPSRPSPARPPARTSPALPKKKLVRRQRTNEVEEPWMVLANFKTPAKNRVQLFLRLNTNRDNKLGEKEIRPLLIKCGIPRHKLDSMHDKFCRHFGSTSRCVTFKQFESVIPSDANEREIFKIVNSLNRTE